MNEFLNRLRALNCDRSDLDELVALKAFSAQLHQTYVDSGLVVPEWVTDAETMLATEIADRRRDALLREEKLLDAKGRGLMTREEQRDEIAKRKAEIAKLLGRAPVEAPVAPVESE